jgi:hypothetical protein
MIKEDIPLYKLDLTGTSKFNLVLQESKSRTDVANSQIFIPPKAPFYQKSFKMYNDAGKLLMEGEDYEFYGIMGKLTQYTGKPVGLFVRILKDNIVSWKMDYQVVGNFNVITNQILKMLESIYQDDRFVMWKNIDNKPLWFIPEIHQQDLAYDIYGFTDLVRELNRIANYVAASGSVVDFMLETFQEKLEVYINTYKGVLTDLLNTHINNKYDAHGVNAAAIGLGNVDNIATADLVQTLDGTRDDLRLTVYNAAKAVEASSGRNDKLFPSGSLPILRYGSDTFIPPTIAGSFEGLGGTSRRGGAIVETDGTLLILNHRNNGKFRGLYFIRCRNWQSTDPIYDFTSYMYTHPTATAAGATLDSIINGSNRYVMVVGDSQKNLWWWCETKGTFNPDRHVLIPLSGEWVTQDIVGNINPADIYNAVDAANVVADANYADYWAIIQGYSAVDFVKRRPSAFPDWPTLGYKAWNSYPLQRVAYSVNIVAGKSGSIRRAHINFTHPLWGNANDSYFMPQVPKYEEINGKRVCTSHWAIYDPPINGAWAFRDPTAYWLNKGAPNDFAIRIELANSNVTVDGSSFQGWAAWAGSFFINRNGSDFSIDVTPAPGFDKIWTVDTTPGGQVDGKKEWSQYYRYVMMGSDYNPSALDNTGNAALTGGYITFMQGFGNTAFPPAYAVVRARYLESAEKMLESPETGPWEFIYDRKTFNETNPLGMGTLFSNQRLVCADSDDYTKACIIATQGTPGVGLQYYFRYVPYLDANFQHIKPSQVSTFQGKTFQNYPFTPSGVLSSIGRTFMLGTHYPRPGVNGKDIFRRMLGVNSDSTISGNVPVNPTDPNGQGKRRGDGLWPFDAQMKIVNGVPELQVLTVINVIPAIQRTLTPLMVAQGWTADQVLETYSAHHFQSPNGDWHAVWLFVCVNVPDVYYGGVVTKVTPKGTPVTKDGYQYYDDCDITVLSPVKRTIRPGISVSNQIFHPYFDAQSGENLANCIGIPYKAWDRSNNTYDNSGYYGFIQGVARYYYDGNQRPIQLHFEVTADGSTMTKLDFRDTANWGPENFMAVNPYHGVGNPLPNSPIFEGAAVASDILETKGNIWDNFNVNTYQGTSVIGMSNILTPQFTVYFQAARDVLISGKMYDIPATYIDILNQDANPANKTYNVYLQYANGAGTYKISSDILPESSSQALIARVFCGPTQIDRIEPYNRFTMDGAQISAKREGSAILASSGSLFDIGDTTTILLDSDFIS